LPKRRKLHFVEGWTETAAESGIDSLVGDEGMEMLMGKDGNGGEYLEAGWGRRKPAARRG